MEAEQSAMYTNLAAEEQEQIFFFLLNNFRCSRLDTGNETEEDEALNPMLDAYNRWHSEPTWDNRNLFYRASSFYREFNQGFDPTSLEGPPARDWIDGGL